MGIVSLLPSVGWRDAMGIGQQAPGESSSQNVRVARLRFESQSMICLRLAHVSWREHPILVDAV
jgi:hypothetical protein